MFCPFCLATLYWSLQRSLRPSSISGLCGPWHLWLLLAQSILEISPSPTPPRGLLQWNRSSRIFGRGSGLVAAEHCSSQHGSTTVMLSAAKNSFKPNNSHEKTTWKDATVVGETGSIDGKAKNKPEQYIPKSQCPSSTCFEFEHN